MDKITATVPIDRYNELLEIEKEYNKKNFFATIVFQLGRQYSPHFSERFYYLREDDIPEKVKLIQDLFDNILKNLTKENIKIESNEDRENAFTKILSCFNEYNWFKHNRK